MKITFIKNEKNILVKEVEMINNSADETVQNVIDNLTVDELFLTSGSKIDFA